MLLYIWNPISCLIAYLLFRYAFAYICFVLSYCLLIVPLRISVLVTLLPSFIGVPEGRASSCYSDRESTDTVGPLLNHERQS